MTKPDDVPQDVWDAAEAALDLMPSHGVQMRHHRIENISRAILARDAVWASAASYGDGSPMFTPDRLRESIAGLMASRDTAIMAEREACAQVVDTMAEVIMDESKAEDWLEQRRATSAQVHAVQAAAAAIRNRA